MDGTVSFRAETSLKMRRQPELISFSYIFN